MAMKSLTFMVTLAGLALAFPQLRTTQTNSTVVPPLFNNSSPTSNSSIKLASVNSNWWFANIDHTSGAVRDYTPNIGDDNYQVFVSVSTSQQLYDAVNSGATNNNLAAQPRVIYIQPGTYSLSRKLVLTTDMVLIGDAVNPPTLKASSGFSDPWVVLGGHDLKYYCDNNGCHNQGGELYFSVAIHNVIIDTTAATGNQDLYGLSWRVAQNAALVNVQINMPPQLHTGLYLGQGSTVQVADVSFSYGNVGIEYDGMQQATIKNAVFSKCTTGITVSGGFTANIFGSTFDTVGQAIRITNVGAWLSVVDTNSINSGTFLTAPDGVNLMLEGVTRDNDRDVLVVNNNQKISNNRDVGHYVYGNTYGATPVYQTNNQVEADSRPSALLVNGKYPNISPNQYKDSTASDVINLKDTSQNGGMPLYGDSQSNDGPALQKGLDTAAAAGKIAYLPFGIYKTQDTITIPPSTRLVGNGWSTISGIGQKFSDPNNPQPVVQVGQPGSTGTAEIQDIRFTVGEQLPGAIILQVNMAGAPGDVAIHNSLITVGGTKDTSIDCGDSDNCAAAYLGLHLSSSSSAYINNVWVWVADHSVDGSSAGTNVAAKGGVLVEATRGTWLSGLGSEHFWYYNLGYSNAQNVMVSLFQSETNYREGDGGASNPPPQPFTPTSSDPDFSWCSSGQAICPMTINQWFTGTSTSNILSYGSGSWNFPQNNQNNEQANVNVIHQTPTNLQLYGLCDGPNAHYIMRLENGTRFGDGSNDDFGGSWRTLVAQLRLG